MFLIVMRRIGENQANFLDNHEIFINNQKNKNRMGESMRFYRAGNVTRTRDLLITNQLHYRLCYSSESCVNYYTIIIGDSQ